MQKDAREKRMRMKKRKSSRELHLLIISITSKLLRKIEERIQVEKEVRKQYSDRLVSKDEGKQRIGGKKHLIIFLRFLIRY